MQHLLQDFQNVSIYSGASRNKGLTLKHENVLRWLDNDFILTVIKAAYVTFAFRSKPCCKIFLKFNMRVFCFYVQILSPNVARLLSPKVADLRAFTKIPFGLTLAFSFAENIPFMKLGFRSFIVWNISKAKFLSHFISIDGFWLSFSSVW